MQNFYSSIFSDSLSCAHSCSIAIIGQKHGEVEIKKNVLTILLHPYSGDVTSFLMTEARQHNTEIRQSIVKVADKVEQLTSKVWTLCINGKWTRIYLAPFFSILVSVFCPIMV